MSTFMKRLFLCIIGIVCGLAVWPFAEISLALQTFFPTYLIFTLYVGLIVGLIMGIFFGSGEGVTLSDKSKIVSGMVTGALIGMLGGIAGFFIGQAVLFFLGNYLMHSMKSFNTFGLPVSRGISWAFLGAFIGLTEGIRAKSFRKLRVGILGGLFGGIIGGIVLEYLAIILPDMIYARLTGLVILGFSIGLFYGFIEKNLSFGIIRLLNGKFKGKEFLLNQRKIKIGKSESNDIKLYDYENIDDYHAEIFAKKKEVFIKNFSNRSPVRVNDDIIKEHNLKLEDVIKIGEAKFLFKFK